MIVEIKSNLRKEDIVQMKRKMDGVFQLLPEHRNKTFRGMIACVSGSTDLKKEVLDNGWYLAHIGEDLFELETPENFVAKTYSATA
jgi:Tat protein secretion system quality control protein TatD with DNase activity